MSRSRQTGTAWESAIVQYLQDEGWPNAERRALKGRCDRGDIAGIVGVVIEAKATREIDLSGFLIEAQTEAARGNDPIGVAWIKRRLFTSPGSAYVLMDGRTFVELLRGAGFQ